MAEKRSLNTEYSNLYLANTGLLEDKVEIRVEPLAEAKLWVKQNLRATSSQFSSASCAH